LHVAILFIGLLALIFGPQIWVRIVMRRHAGEIANLPGTGGELATHLIEAHDLDGVTVEMTEASGDHYDPVERCVRLSPTNYGGKSLTAVAIAAHEVGHALQHRENDRRLELRTRMGPIVHRLGKLSITAMWLAPLVGLITRHPAPFSLMLLLGLSGLVARVLMHLVTLPTEWDASFGKALPILIRDKYIAPGEQPAVRQVLRAAALTYFSSALADVLNLARWAMILLRR
jgi:Zn-dependent membrane protease YugP